MRRTSTGWWGRGRNDGRSMLATTTVIDRQRIDAGAHRHDDLAPEAVDRHPRIDAHPVAIDEHAQPAQHALAERQAIEQPLLELAVVLLHHEVLHVHALAVEKMIAA